ncbi:tyrosine-protein kinase-like otk isoform X2 [Pelmatolapia mariae]|uniref:tyrosine-protein kinase-like otk isoform X2 n=1 Tax=Pelmatolapia mariae TaxID=158779 RepID=UPI002FE54839
MAAGPQWLCATLLFVVFVSADQKNITAESGQDVTLTCRAPNNIKHVKWIRSDLKKENVFWYQNGHFDPANQHPSFENRVDLQDRQMKDGDVSLILKNVTTHDTGTYECHVFMNETRSWKSTNIVYLSVVVPPDEKTIKAEFRKKSVTLTCRAPNRNITVVNWRRADLKSEYVLLYQDGNFHPDNQHPSFKNRVYLQDRQMKDGDVSLILKNVTINDAGRYNCRVVMEGTRSSKLMVLGIINLKVVVPPDESIPAESGQDVTLTSRAPNRNITAVKWSRADLGDEYVLLYRDGQFETDNQHPSFKNRVDLQDRQMKDGDVSLILKNVTINDTGTYECRVAQNSEEDMEHVSHISLIVGDESIPAESGQDVTLTSRAPNRNITAVKWSRADLGDEYVLLYRDGQFETDNQHPFFKNRVDLQDRQMKDGDVSLILKNVTINDAGTFECRVFMRKAYFMETISVIGLDVFSPGPSGGFIGLIVVILLLFVGVVFLSYRKHKVSRYSYEVSTENNEAPQSP